MPSRMELTAAQMSAAPQGAIYIWCSAVTLVPRELAVSLNRPDLRIYPYIDPNHPTLRALQLPIVVDHWVASGT